MPFPGSSDRDPSNLPWWLHWVESCPSTNTWAMTHANSLHHGAVVFTRRQTAGRGQHGRTWHSPTGVLTASFILDRFPTAQLPGLSLVIGLAVIQAVEDLLPDQRGRFRLKWPNDVLIEGRKLAGILCEAAFGSSSERTRVVVGIGLNRCVNFVQAGLFTAQVGNAISLDQISSLVPEEFALLERLRYYLVQVSDILSPSGDSPRAGITSWLPELHRRDGLRDRPIVLELDGETISGQATGFDNQGRLLLQLPDGAIRTFASGRVTQF